MDVSNNRKNLLGCVPLRIRANGFQLLSCFLRFDMKLDMMKPNISFVNHHKRRESLIIDWVLPKQWKSQWIMMVNKASFIKTNRFTSPISSQHLGMPQLIDFIGASLEVGMYCSLHFYWLHMHERLAANNSARRWAMDEYISKLALPPNFLKRHIVLGRVALFPVSSYMFFLSAPKIRRRYCDPKVTKDPSWLHFIIIPFISHEMSGPFNSHKFLWSRPTIFTCSHETPTVPAHSASLIQKWNTKFNTYIYSYIIYIYMYFFEIYIYTPYLIDSTFHPFSVNQNWVSSRHQVFFLLRWSRSGV